MRTHTGRKTTLVKVLRRNKKDEEEQEDAILEPTKKKRTNGEDNEGRHTPWPLKNKQSKTGKKKLALLFFSQENTIVHDLIRANVRVEKLCSN